MLLALSTTKLSRRYGRVDKCSFFLVAPRLFRSQTVSWIIITPLGCCGRGRRCIFRGSTKLGTDWGYI